MRQEIKAIIVKLEQAEQKVEIFLENANDRVNPNEDRIAELETELDAIRQAIEILQEIE